MSLALMVELRGNLIELQHYLRMSLQSQKERLVIMLCLCPSILKASFRPVLIISQVCIMDGVVDVVGHDADDAADAHYARVHVQGAGVSTWLRATRVES